MFPYGLRSNICSSMVLPMDTATTHTTTGFSGEPVVDCGAAALSVTDSMINIDHQLSHLPAKTALELIEFCRRRLDASEARFLADSYESGASDRDVENMAGGSDGKTSKATAKKRARRAKATNANPDLADRLADGDMSSEQVDVIAEAAEETNGEAACDQDLINTVASTNPEQGKKKAREFVNKRRNQDDVQKRFDRQRRKRGVYRHRLNNGNSAITIHGPDEEIDEIETRIHNGSDQEYRLDGGRDVANQKHRRTRDQRNYDAAHTIFTQTTSTQTNEKPDSDSSDVHGAVGQKSSRKAPSKKSSPKTSRRAVIFVASTVDQWTGKDLSPMTTIDGKPLPRSFVEELAGDAAFIGQVFSVDGELLWQGRKHRLATPAQINGLISRDKGCVQCGVGHSKCVAHHLLPWEAAAHYVRSTSFSASPPNVGRGGPTNIDNLALLCQDCHIRLHRAKQTMFYDIGSQTWKTRPATQDEIPPDGGPKLNKPPGKYQAAKSKQPRTKQQQPEQNTRRSTKPSLFERQPAPGIRTKT